MEQINETPRVKVERGQRGGYGWRISIPGDDLDKIVDEIKRIDSKLRLTFLSDNTHDIKS
jgi:cystathionine beta-lyase family protein involved in aluminum resistance